MEPTPRLRHSLAMAAVLFVALFALAGNALAQTTPTWIPLTPTGGPPAARNAHSAVIDEANDRMIVFGGSFFNCPGGCLNDVWVLTNADGLGGTPAWTQLAPTGPPPSVRTGHSAVYSPGTNRMIIFGGDLAAGFCVVLPTMSGCCPMRMASAVPRPGRSSHPRAGHRVHVCYILQFTTRPATE
jgi:hypothetical protein